MFFCFNLIGNIVFSQDLILNGDFEAKIKLSNHPFANKEDILYWNKEPIYKLGQGGYIYPFFIQQVKNMKSPHFLYKRNGVCYASIREGKKIGSVLFCKLNSCLIRDSIYNLNFIFNCFPNLLNDKEEKYVDFLFVKKPLSNFDPKTIIKSKAIVKSLKITKYITLPEIWDSVRFVFKAKGDENYMYIIGRKDKYYKEVKNPFLDTSNYSLYDFNIDNISLKKGKSSLPDDDILLQLDPYKHFKPEKIDAINTEFFPVSCYMPNGIYINDSLCYNENFIRVFDNIVHTMESDSNLFLKINLYRNMSFPRPPDFLISVIEKYVRYICFYGIDAKRINYEIFSEQKYYNEKYSSLYQDKAFNVGLKLYKK